MNHLFDITPEMCIGSKVIILRDSDGEFDLAGIPGTITICLNKSDYYDYGVKVDINIIIKNSLQPAFHRLDGTLFTPSGRWFHQSDLMVVL